MVADAAIAPNLTDLLGRTWHLAGPVETAAFEPSGTAVAFVAGGALALASLEDPERPETRIRLASDDGRRTIAPRRQPPRPVAQVGAARAPVAPSGPRRFVAAGAEGGLLLVEEDGSSRPVEGLPAAPVSAIAPGPDGGSLAVATERIVVLFPGGVEGAPPHRLDAPGPVSALAFLPGGALASAHPGGLTVWRGGAEPTTIAVDGDPVSAVPRRDGTLLACSLAGGGFALVDLRDGHSHVVGNYPAPVSSISFVDEPAAIATSGAFRIASWLLEESGDLGEPLATGRPGFVAATALAAAPGKPLVAAGYESGNVVVAKLAERDEMLLRPEGAPVTVLAFSPDGSHLAIGDAAGRASLVAFPRDIFK